MSIALHPARHALFGEPDGVPCSFGLPPGDACRTGPDAPLFSADSPECHRSEAWWHAPAQEP